MRYRYRLAGVAAGVVVGLLIAGNEWVASVAVCLFSVPLGAAIGYFVDSAQDVLASGMRSSLGHASPTGEYDESDFDPYGFRPEDQERDGLGLYVEDMDTRRSLVDIRIV